ncbi:MAG TPA: phosphoglycerate kinase [Thermoplasmata archaeon]|nr:phosphoglycerate kinase [Thermoplasmata archaeon]
MAAKRGIASAPVHGRRVLVRVDFNVPLDANGRIADDRRIQEAMPTLNHLRASGARTILLSHLGRPEGKRDPRFSLRPVAHHLSELLGQPVSFAEDIVGSRPLELATKLENGQFLMLENLRFHPGEEANDPGFATQLASLGQVFIEDAFGTVHRAHASTVGVPQRLPAFAGLLVEREVRELSKLVESPARPYVVLVGGAKVADKLPLLTSFLGRADSLLIGGALAFPFLRAQNAHLGATVVEGGLKEAVEGFFERAQRAGTEVVLPSDLVAERPGTTAVTVHSTGHLPPGAVARDIGPETRARFVDALSRSKTVFWNGPLGLAEDPRFAAGTQEVLARLGEVAGYHVAAGGDSARVATDLGVAGSFQFISTGGGAALEFVQGLELPGLAVLPDA